MLLDCQHYDVSMAAFVVTYPSSYVKRSYLVLAGPPRHVWQRDVIVKLQLSVVGILHRFNLPSLIGR